MTTKSRKSESRAPEDLSGELAAALRIRNIPGSEPCWSRSAVASPGGSRSSMEPTWEFRVTPGRAMPGMSSATKVRCKGRWCMNLNAAFETRDPPTRSPGRCPSRPSAASGALPARAHRKSGGSQEAGFKKAGLAFKVFAPSFPHSLDPGRKPGPWRPYGRPSRHVPSAGPFKWQFKKSWGGLGGQMCTPLVHTESAI